MADRRYPFDSMEQFFDQMRREMFGGWDTMMGDWDRSWDRPALSDRDRPMLAGSDTWDAGISIDETDTGFVVLADLPGFEREELSLKLYDDVLVIRGEHEVDDGYQSRSRTVHERISLPAHADPENVDASYRNGVLEIEFIVDDDERDSGMDIDIE